MIIYLILPDLPQNFVLTGNLLPFGSIFATIFIITGFTYRDLVSREITENDRAIALRLNADRFAYERKIMDNSLEIDFAGQFGFLGNHDHILFNETISESSGIYIWTARMKNVFIIEYIGMTTQSFGKRSLEHIVNTFGGNYRICDSKLMKEGIEAIIWPGLCRKKNAISEFSKKYLEIAPSILKYLQTIEVFTATMNNGRRTIERIEGALARHVWNQPPPASALLPKDVRYRIRKENEKPIHVSIHCDREILGVPHEIEA